MMQHSGDGILRRALGTRTCIRQLEAIPCNNSSHRARRQAQGTQVRKITGCMAEHNRPPRHFTGPGQGLQGGHHHVQLRLVPPLHLRRGGLHPHPQAHEEDGGAGAARHEEVDGAHPPGGELLARAPSGW
jgi:hypothetical protein